MAKKIVPLSFWIAIIWIVSASVLSNPVAAQQTVNQPSASEQMIDFKVLTGLIVESVVFSIVGLVILMIGYKVFDLVTPYHLDKQIADENNTAAGIALAGVLIALGLIVAAAIG